MGKTMHFLPILAALLSPALLAQGDGTFGSVGNLSPIAKVGPVVALAAGDFNRDGRKDLAATDGGRRVTILLQGAERRGAWTTMTPIVTGAANFQIQAADLDSDGDSDLAIADPGAMAAVLFCQGDGTFAPALTLKGSQGSRWLAIGDFDADGKQDIASANWRNATVTVHLQEPGPSFSLKQTIQSQGDPHSIAAMEMSGDGHLDLLAGVDTFGFVFLQGSGDGKFEPKKPFGGIDSCYRHAAAFDLDGDGRQDLITGCRIGFNLGNGTFRMQGLPTYTDHVGVGDLDNDGILDIATSGPAMVENGYSVSICRGTGLGTFLSPVDSFLLGLIAPGAFLVEDMDANGITDIVGGGTATTGILARWGVGTGQIRDRVLSLEAFGPAKDVGTADFDRDGRPDIFVLSGNQAKVKVYLSSAQSPFTVPSLEVQTAQAITSLHIADLDGNGALDFAGPTLTTGSVLVSLLAADGTIQKRASLVTGSSPARVFSGLFDAGISVDLAVLGTRTNDLALFPGAGEGAFSAGERNPSIARPKNGLLGDADGDGFIDLVVYSTEEVGIHYGRQGGFTQASRIHRDEAMRVATLILVDLDSDGLADLLGADIRLGASGLLIFKGRGGRSFADPELILRGLSAPSIAVYDFNGDGSLDVSATNPSSKSVAIAFGRSDKGLDSPVESTVGFIPTGHKLGDFDGDGAQDILVHSSSTATILFGNRSTERLLRRGDGDGDSKVEVNDAIIVLEHLFLGGKAVLCLDAADANDDGQVNLSDPIALLDWLFLGGAQPPVPGPTLCGPDGTPDALSCDTVCG